ncbi:hypothetical protein I4U23_023305 [Adineta vaga]|nr:hypothetical protein I4U23_023305 [Adineta vaga]
MSSCKNESQSQQREYFTPTIVSKYINTLFNSPLYNEWISSIIFNALELQPDHILVDMGCGPGTESLIILNKMKNRIRIIGVDPSQGMLDIFEKESNFNPNIEAVCKDAVQFSQSNEYSSYDRIFLKSMIHLLTSEQRLTAFEGFYKQLVSKKGRLLIIRGPVHEKIFPFDERTENLFRQGNNLVTLFDELKQAGFKRIEEETFTFEYPSNSIKAEDWIYLIENRVWTLFSHENMNDQQMNDLIDYVKKQFQSPNHFQTIDKQTIIKCYVD